MKRTVLLPKELEQRLVSLANLKSEVNGVLLYRPKEEYCPIETIFITGKGTEGHVSSTPERMAIVNEFFEKNPEYNFVKFHTHSKGTIEKFGEYYARNFSEADLEGFKEHFKENKTYIGMLITPETRLLCGLDNPKLEVVKGFPGYASRSKAVDQAVLLIANRLGYELNIEV